MNTTVSVGLAPRPSWSGSATFISWNGWRADLGFGLAVALFDWRVLGIRISWRSYWHRKHLIWGGRGGRSLLRSQRWPTSI